MYIEYDFGVEYHSEDGKNVVLVVGDTIYFWTDEFTRIKNTYHEFDMVYSDVFGLRFLSDENESSKEILRSLFLAGMKAHHNIETYPFIDTLAKHMLYKRDKEL